MIRFIVLIAACAACATAPIPNERLASTEASIRGAQEAGADAVPQAQLHLKFATEGIAQARKLIAERRNEEAGLVLDRARADAELAVGLSREAQVKAEAEQALAQVAAIKANP